MKKNKLFKRTALALGTVATVAAPVAAVVSCGNSIGRYEGNTDNKLTLLVDYREGKQQYKAIKAQIDTFNGLGKGFSVNLVSSYPLQGALTSTYQSQDKNKMANLAITYPDTVGLVTHYGQQLDFSKTSPAISRADLDKNFDPQFTDVNDKIGGLKTGGTYALPITKSTDMLTINKLVLGYLITTMGYNPASGSKLADAVTAYGNADQAEKDKIIKSYKAKATPLIPTDLNISDDIFVDGSKMLDFTIAVGDYFDLHDKTNTNKKSFLLGIDSATNFIYNSINSMTDGKAKDFPFYKDDKTGWITYQFKNDAIKAKIKGIYEKFQTAINNGSLFIAGTVSGQKEYGSNFLKDHRMAISAGSTAGYAYNFNPDGDTAKGHENQLNKGESLPLPPIEKYGEKSTPSVLVQGPSLIGLHVTDKEDDEAATFVKWLIGDASSSTPLATFTAAAGYLAPTKTFLSGDGSSVSGGNKIAFDALKSVNDGTGTPKKVLGFDNPVDDTTGEARVNLQDAIHEQYAQFQDGTKAKDINSIYSYIQDNFKAFE